MVFSEGSIVTDVTILTDGSKVETTAFEEAIRTALRNASIDVIGVNSCVGPTSCTDMLTPMLAGILGTIGGLIIIVAIALLFYWVQRRRVQQSYRDDRSESSYSDEGSFSYNLPRPNYRHWYGTYADDTPKYGVPVTSYPYDIYSGGEERRRPDIPRNINWNILRAFSQKPGMGTSLKHDPFHRQPVDPSQAYNALGVDYQPRPSGSDQRSEGNGNWGWSES
jgi:hypothetical protein